MAESGDKMSVRIFADDNPENREHLEEQLKQDAQEAINISDCYCPISRTDGQPPCAWPELHGRPDGFYCDCGHQLECHPNQPARSN